MVKDNKEYVEFTYENFEYEMEHLKDKVLVYGNYFGEPKGIYEKITPYNIERILCYMRNNFDNTKHYSREWFGGYSVYNLGNGVQLFVNNEFENKYKDTDKPFTVIGDYKVYGNYILVKNDTNGNPTDIDENDVKELLKK